VIRAAALAALLVARPALAATEGGHGGGLSTLLWQALNLAILVGVLIYFARKPVAEFLARRRSSIQHDLDASARLLAESEARLAEWKQRAARLDAELAEIRDASRRLAEQEREAILAQARVSAERIRRDANVAVEQELQRARARLSEEAAELAVQLAGKLVREQVREDDERRLFDELVARLETGAPRGDGR
jgi:F-type H+-transporting ATPase subunit b